MKLEIATIIASEWGTSGHDPLSTSCQEEHPLDRCLSRMPVCYITLLFGLVASVVCMYVI